MTPADQVTVHLDACTMCLFNGIQQDGNGEICPGAMLYHKISYIGAFLVILPSSPLRQRTPVASSQAAHGQRLPLVRLMAQSRVYTPRLSICRFIGSCHTK